VASNSHFLLAAVVDLLTTWHSYSARCSAVLQYFFSALDEEIFAIRGILSDLIFYNGFTNPLKVYESPFPVLIA